PLHYAAVDEIRAAHSFATGRGVSGVYSNGSGRNDGETHGSDGFVSVNPLGKLPGSVWPIPLQPLTVPQSLGVDHFAAFPLELPRRIIAGWSPPGVCVACGQGRRPIAEAQYRMLDRFPDRRSDSMAINGTGTPGSGQ